MHFPELTVKDTLAFAAATREPGSGYNPITYSAGEDIASIFRLNDVLHTVVGNPMIRGISGGEKKRVTIAEAFVNNAQLQCWDNNTRGLDSATALAFIELLRKSAHLLGSVIIICLYQASEAMYDVSTKHS